MYGVISSSAVWLQVSDGTAVATTSDAHLTMIFVGIIAVCLLLVMVALVGGLVAIMALRKKIVSTVEATLQKANPVIAEATSLFNEVSPHVRKITANVSSISDTVKQKVDQFDGTLTEVNDKTKRQVARVDGMVSDALTSTSDIANTIHRGIRAPIREVAGVVAGVKAAMDVLFTRDGNVGAGTYSGGMPGVVTPISTRRAEAASEAPPTRIHGV